MFHFIAKILYKKFTQQVYGMFKEWQFTKHTISSGLHCLWVANGFMFFDDYDTYGAKPFLVGFNTLEKRIIYNEYIAEVKRRALKHIDHSKKQIIQKILSTTTIKATILNICQKY